MRLFEPDFIFVHFFQRVPINSMPCPLEHMPPIRSHFFREQPLSNGRANDPVDNKRVGVVGIIPELLQPPTSRLRRPSKEVAL